MKREEMLERAREFIFSRYGLRGPAAEGVCMAYADFAMAAVEEQRESDAMIAEQL